MKLYHYPRSSASYRVRIALGLKGLPFELENVNLLEGRQSEPAYAALNPQQLVPTLVDGEVAIGQSLAAIEYLEERYPEPALLPDDARGRARVRQLALIVACEIHPLQNLGVLQALGRDFGADEAQRRSWARGVIERGLAALAEVIGASRPPGPYCHGARPTLADVCLVPQLFNARKFECALDAVPTLLEIEARCFELEAFRRAAPPPPVPGPSR